MDTNNMAFDPTKYGATPVSQASGFDPTKYGATPVAQAQSPKQSLSDQIWQSLAGYGKNISNTLQGAGEQVNSAFNAPGQGAVERRINTAGAVAGGALNTVASAIPGATGLGNGIGSAVNAAGNIGNTLGTIANKIPGVSFNQSKYDANNAAFANSPAGSATNRIATVGNSLGNVANVALAGVGAAQGIQSGVDTIKDTTNTVRGISAVSNTLAPETSPVAQSTSQMAAETGKIIDSIMPKANAAEVRLALDQGRISPGQDPTLLRDGTPDSIMPSDKTARAAATIQARISGAADMHPQELSTALSSEVADISKELRPQMEAVPITEDIVQKISNDWMNVKAQQAADPYMPTTVNLEKLQANFEQNILQKARPNNLGDLWDARIKYDSSVPVNVKEATALSSDTLQAQKSMWLQNRAILNDAITNASEGLGKVAKGAFSDMTDMYNAQKGIRSSYSLPKKGASSKLGSFLDTPTGKAVKIGAGVVGAGALFKTGEAILP